MMTLVKAVSVKACAFAFFSTLTFFSTRAEKNASAVNPHLSFTENKGQITDQFYKERKDVLFKSSDGHLSFFLKRSGVSYQQFKIDSWKNETDPVTGKTRQFPDKTIIYRLDIQWLNANPSAEILKQKALTGKSNYYTPAYPNGIVNVGSYEEIVYKNLYDGIDLKWYQKDHQVKYDFVVSAGADYKNIQLQISGAKNLSINTKGELIIETPLGTIVEEAPLVFQGTKTLKSRWVIKGDVIGFNIEGADATKPMTIDPGVRVWGTYYGGTGGDSSLNSAVDSNGNIYMAGTTSSSNGNSIATVGSHQVTFGGGQDNAYLAKFNSNGVRQWSTFYGGPVREFGLNVAVDNSGNVFMVGHSLSAPGSIVATPGSHQPVFGGIWDAYLVKFNSNGIRQWGTYYGGSGLEHGNGVACDAAGNVYITGKTDESTANIIATPGSHQSVFGGIEDCFLAKFNTNGVRQWATYYGGSGTDVGRGVTVDAAGNVYITGWTDNTVANVIGSPGSHQNTFGGGNLDAFIAKFNSNGVRQWGTQYGGNGTDMAYDCAIDIFGNVYMAGKTASTNSISSSSAHQTTFGGGPQDAFLVSFNSNGVRNWGTYYGGSGDEESWGCAIHVTGHINIVGHTTTSSGTAVATPGTHQPNFGGGSWDAFIAQFDTAGVRTWGSYYGETGDEVGYGCTTDNALHIYMTGSTDSNTGNAIATVGSHQPIYGAGWGDAYLVKFYDCPAPLAPSNTTTPASLRYCAPGSTTLTVVSTSSVSWYASPSSTLSLGSGTTFVTPVLNAGTHTYYAEAVSSCTVSAMRTAITITVDPLPNINILATPTLVCAGKSTTMTAFGADTYTWNTGSTTPMTIETPSVSGVYTVSGTNTLNCTNTQTVAISVYTLDPVVLTASSYTTCLTIFGGSAVSLTGTPSGGTYGGSNVSGNFFNPTALGIYHPTYTYTNSTNGCVNSASTTVIVYSCLSITESENLNSTVKIAPNPGAGVFTLDHLPESSSEIMLYDVSGKLLQKVNIENTSHTLDLSNLSDGVYFVRIVNANGSINRKLIKQGD